MRKVMPFILNSMLGLVLVLSGCGKKEEPKPAPSQTATAQMPEPSPTAQAPTPPSQESPTAPRSPEGTTPSPPEAVGSRQGVDIVAADAGGRIASFTSQFHDKKESAERLIQRTGFDPWRSAESPSYPQEIVFSFAGGQPALITTVVLNLWDIKNPWAQDKTKTRWAKGVEIWTSMDSPSAGFKRVGSMSLRPEAVEQTIEFSPVEARYVKLRILSNQGDSRFVELRDVKIIEGQRSGYVPLLARQIPLPAGASDGIVARYFSDASYNKLAKSVVTQTVSVDSNSDGKPSWVEWEGLLKVPKAGMYEFRLEGDGNGFLYMDGRRVIRERKKAGDKKPLEGKLFLEAGAHTIRVAAIEAQEAGKFSLTWKKPADQNYSPIDPKLLSHTEAQRQWRRTPRQAAQVGLEWLQSDSLDWQRQHTCFGCHVQGQAIMGMSVAKGNKYIVRDEYLSDLVNFTRWKQKTDGTYHQNNHVTATQFAAMTLSFFDRLTNAKENTTLRKSADWLLTKQKSDGEIRSDLSHEPIAQGSIMTSANSVTAFMQTFNETGEGKYKEAADRALDWISKAKVQPWGTTQDKIFKVIALYRHGTPEQKRIADTVVQQLKSEQMADGGWKETVPKSNSSDFATGQALCALKEAGVAVNSPHFRKGVRFLLDTQQVTGTWKKGSAGTDFARTMWPVICLAGAFANEEFVPGGTLQLVSDIQRAKKATKNLVIILDVSGSMNERLGKMTRWGTALGVFKEVVEKLPDDFNVGLRVYAHRHPPASRGKTDIIRLPTCKDTELLVPVEKLDRGRILSAINKLKPRGETPLVYSVLETVKDLKRVRGGSVILITDGEETCGGDPVSAVQKLNEAGLDISLNIVGFAIKGKQIEQQLTAFAEATGGRYYSAQSGKELTRALLIAAVDRLPYAILDTAGKEVAKGETGDPPEELVAGKYKVVVTAADQQLEAQDVTIARDKNTVLKVVLKGDRFALEHGKEEQATSPAARGMDKKEKATGSP